MTPSDFPGPDTRFCRSIARSLVWIALSLALTAPAFAGGYLDSSSQNTPKEKPGWAVPAKRMPVEGEGVEASEAKLKNAEMRLREAQQNASTAAYTYKRARTRNYPRGEALIELENRLAEMNKELADAERELVQTVEQARRDGVPAGILMPYMDLADAVRRNQQDRGSE